MNNINQLYDWGNKVANAFYWCQTNLTPETWRYLGNGQFDFNNDRDYTMFILRTKE